MSSDMISVFTKENLNMYLKELGKEFRKLNGTGMSAEIVLIGGAAILASYDFREMTTDIDAVIHASSSIKDAINRVGDKYDLPNSWLNSDFTHTGSYSAKLDEISVYYKTFSNVLCVRTVAAEYLIAMKLRSGRKYKNDLSDVIGILYEHKKQGNPLSLESISAAIEKLYGGWQTISADSKAFIETAFAAGDYERFYADSVAQEKQSREVLISFEKNYPGVTTESNANDILASLKAKRPSLHQQLQELPSEAQKKDQQKIATQAQPQRKTGKRRDRR